MDNFNSYISEMVIRQELAQRARDGERRRLIVEAKAARQAQKKQARPQATKISRKENLGWN